MNTPVKTSARFKYPLKRKTGIKRAFKYKADNGKVYEKDYVESKAAFLTKYPNAPVIDHVAIKSVPRRKRNYWGTFTTYERGLWVIGVSDETDAELQAREDKREKVALKRIAERKAKQAKVKRRAKLNKKNRVYSKTKNIDNLLSSVVSLKRTETVIARQIETVLSWEAHEIREILDLYKEDRSQDMIPVIELLAALHSRRVHLDSLVEV
jgi:hypothetical protein